MWGPKCCPRQYNEGRKSEAVVLRRSYGPARDESNNAYRSTYGVWNEDYGIRCGLWDDVLFQCSRNCQTESKRRRNASVPISKVSTPSQPVRYEALATPKTNGCGPNCKKFRCAATDPPYYYAKPYCAADKRKKRTKESSVKKYTYSTMAHVQDEGLDQGRYDMTMGLKNIKKVEEEVEVLPRCERNCGECSETPREPEVEAPEKRNGSGLKSLMRTVGINTEQVSETEVRVLQDVSNSAVVLNWSKKMAPPVVPKLKIPTPIPRVAYLRPPKPRLKDIIEYEGEPVPTPRLGTPRTPRPTWSSSLTSRRVPPRGIPPQTHKFMPGKLAPRLFTPPTTLHFPRTGSFSPRSPVPPELEKIQHKIEPPPQLQPVPPPKPSPQQSSKRSSERSSDTMVSSKESFKQPSEQASKQSSNQSSSETMLSSNESFKQHSQQSSKQSSKQSSETMLSSKESFKQHSPQSSKESSKADSLVTSVSDFENSSCSTEGSIPTPMLCLCSLCGKAESINNTSQANSAAIYRNNPLYSPGRALTTTTDPRTANNNSSRWRFLNTFLEIMFLVVLAGVLTVGMIPYVETVFRAYVADYCKGCSGKGKGDGSPQVTADGMQNGVVKWVNCMMGDTRSTLTPVR